MEFYANSPKKNIYFNLTKISRIKDTKRLFMSTKLWFILIHYHSWIFKSIRIMRVKISNYIKVEEKKIKAFLFACPGKFYAAQLKLNGGGHENRFNANEQHCLILLYCNENNYYLTRKRHSLVVQTHDELIMDFHDISTCSVCVLCVLRVMWMWKRS
jgi:uncharacterized protein with PQ loop repeat